MKAITVIFLFALLSFSLAAQNTIKRKPFVAHTQKMESVKILLKSTGKEMTEKEQQDAYIKHGSYINLEPVIDERGNIIHYIFDPEKPVHKGPKEIKEMNVSIGEKFPNFILTTTDNEVINLQELKGKTVLIRFELNTISLNVPSEDISTIDKELKSLSSELTNNLEAIAIFGSSQEEIKKELKDSYTNFKLIPDGWNFFRKYSVYRFPTTIIIDKNGILVKQFSATEKLNLKEVLSDIRE